MSVAAAIEGVLARIRAAVPSGVAIVVRFVH